MTCLLYFNHHQPYWIWWNYTWVTDIETETEKDKSYRGSKWYNQDSNSAFQTKLFSVHHLIVITFSLRWGFCTWLIWSSKEKNVKKFMNRKQISWIFIVSLFQHHVFSVPLPLKLNLMTEKKYTILCVYKILCKLPIEFLFITVIDLLDFLCFNALNSGHICFFIPFVFIQELKKHGFKRMTLEYPIP